tara:strand:+ start:116 stop:277 length:162 start_codon:yes stop_codon:yes gene_type:complete
MKEDDYQMTVYEWDEDFYNEIIKDHNFSFGKFNPINYPFQNDNNYTRKTSERY